MSTTSDLQHYDEEMNLKCTGTDSQLASLDGGQLVFLHAFHEMRRELAEMAFNHDWQALVNVIRPQGKEPKIELPKLDDVDGVLDAIKKEIEARGIDQEYVSNVYDNVSREQKASIFDFFGEYYGVEFVESKTGVESSDCVVPSYRFSADLSFFNDYACQAQQGEDLTDDQLVFLLAFKGKLLDVAEQVHCLAGKANAAQMPSVTDVKNDIELLEAELAYRGLSLDDREYPDFEASISYSDEIYDWINQRYGIEMLADETEEDFDFCFFLNFAETRCVLEDLDNEYLARFYVFNEVRRKLVAATVRQRWQILKEFFAHPAEMYADFVGDEDIPFPSDIVYESGSVEAELAERCGDDPDTAMDGTEIEEAREECASTYERLYRETYGIVEYDSPLPSLMPCFGEDYACENGPAFRFTDARLKLCEIEQSHSVEESYLSSSFLKLRVDGVVSVVRRKEVILSVLDILACLENSHDSLYVFRCGDSPSVLLTLQDAAGLGARLWAWACWSDVNGSPRDLTEEQARVVDFVEYVHSYYGTGGVYDMGATREQISEATRVLLSLDGIDVMFDTLDRERVRDILVLMYQLKHPHTDNYVTEHIHQI